MAPVIPAVRVLTAALVVATGLVVGALPGSAVATTTAPSTSGPSTGPGTGAGAGAGASAVQDGDRAVFTGRFVRRSADDPTAYQVQVDYYFGSTPITTRRVTVRSTIAIEDCGTEQPSEGPTRGSGGDNGGNGPGGVITPSAEPGDVQTLEPTAGPTLGIPRDALALDTAPRLFRTVVDGDDYRVTSCRQVTLLDDDVLLDLSEQYGEGTAPAAPEQPTSPGTTVGYRCSDSTTEVEGPEACSALVESPAFDRAAAPGLALVIVGLLGLLVVRRIGRRR